MIEKFFYDNKIVKWFGLASIFWGIIGMLVGVIIAFQLAYPALNFGIPYTTFGRLRPIHTNAVIFAFVGNAVFSGAYFILQRVLKARLFSDVLSKIHFWGWQLIILLGATTLLLGYTTGKEYAELEWPLDIMIALIWVVFGINMIGTILKRRERHLYVSVWFFIGTWVTVAMLHIVCLLYTSRFEEVFGPCENRIHAIITFLAMLELLNQIPNVFFRLHFLDF